MYAKFLYSITYFIIFDLQRFYVNHDSFFYGLIFVIPAIFSNISRKIKLNTFSFQLKDLLW